MRADPGELSNTALKLGFVSEIRKISTENYLIGRKFQLKQNSTLPY